jgi:hypothetical protein
MDDRPEERRRRGPLDEGEPEETTRQVPADDQRTRQVPLEDDPEQTQRIPRERSDPETRVIRTSRGGQEDTVSFPRGYLEAAHEREARLRDMYGGIDWLAGFVGWIIAGVALTFLSLLASVVLVPLGFTLELDPGALGATAITGLIIIGVLLFVAYYAGGYVAGRLARFDGGRNGAMVVVWGLVLGVLLAVAASFLPGEIFGFVQQFVTGSVVPAIGGLAGTGFLGLGILAGVILIALLGGFLGGRAGSRFHRRIDHTT